MACQFLNSARSAGNNFDFPLYTFRIPRSFSFLLCVLCESLMFFAVNFSTFTISKTSSDRRIPIPKNISSQVITRSHLRLGDLEKDHSHLEIQSLEICIVCFLPSFFSHSFCALSKPLMFFAVNFSTFTISKTSSDRRIPTPKNISSQVTTRSQAHTVRLPHCKHKTKSRHSKSKTSRHLLLINILFLNLKSKQTSFLQLQQYELHQTLSLLKHLLFLQSFREI